MEKEEMVTAVVGHFDSALRNVGKIDVWKKPCETDCTLS